MDEERFELQTFDHNLSADLSVETLFAETFKKALEKAIEILKIDWGTDSVLIYDYELDKPRARLYWNNDEGIIEALDLRDNKMVLTSGDEEVILAHYLRR